MFIKRIFMTAADSGGGGGSPPPNPSPAPGTPPAPGASAPAPTPPQATGAAPPLDVQAIAAQISSTVRDAVFADLRRAGVLGKQPSRTTGAPADPAAPASAAPGADPSVLRSLDRVLGRTGHATRLTEAQYGRLERAFVAEQPDNVEQWVSGYFEGWNASTPPGAPQGAPASAAPPQRNAAPVSNGSPPPAPQVPLEERPILSMTAEERAHLIRQKGPQWYRAKLHEQTRGVSVTLSR